MQILDEKLLIQNIDNIAQYDFANNKVFGSAYYVFQEGNLAIERCYGNISVNTDVPVTNATLFRLASMTKPITAVAALILVDRGLLSLDDPIARYLPEFADIHIMDANGTDLGKPKNAPTIRNILCHCSGIGSDGDKEAKILPEDRQTIDSYVKFMARIGLDYDPTTKQQYSGMGAYDVLTKIIELVSGTDYLSFLQKEVFAPCNMVDTTFVPNAEQRERLVSMHTCMEGKNAVYGMQEGCIFEQFPCEHYLGGAGLASTLHDYCNFSKMLLHCGRFNDIQLIREETFHLLCTPQVPKDIMPGYERWGFGVRVIDDEYPYYTPKGAFGWSGAYGSHFWIDLENKIFAVFMKNSCVDGGAGNESTKKFEVAVYSSFK